MWIARTIATATPESASPASDVSEKIVLVQCGSSDSSQSTLVHENVTANTAMNAAPHRTREAPGSAERTLEASHVQSANASTVRTARNGAFRYADFSWSRASCSSADGCDHSNSTGTPK